MAETTWTSGDVSGSTTLIEEDHLFYTHMNEVRVAINANENILTVDGGMDITLPAAPTDHGINITSSAGSASTNRSIRIYHTGAQQGNLYVQSTSSGIGATFYNHGSGGALYAECTAEATGYGYAIRNENRSIATETSTYGIGVWNFSPYGGTGLKLWQYAGCVGKLFDLTNQSDTVAATIAQQGNSAALSVSKAGTGAGNAVSISNSGSGYGLYVSNATASTGGAVRILVSSTVAQRGMTIDQNTNAPALVIESLVSDDGDAITVSGLGTAGSPWALQRNDGVSGNMVMEMGTNYLWFASNRIRVAGANPTDDTSGNAMIAQGDAWTPKSQADAAATNSTVYYSTTQSKLVFKDSGGTVRDLY